MKYRPWRLSCWRHAFRWLYLSNPRVEDKGKSVDLGTATRMIAVSGKRAEEVEAQLDVRCRSFVRGEDPRRGTGGSRHRICLDDVEAGLSVAFCRFSVDNRWKLVICYSM